MKVEVDLDGFDRMCAQEQQRVVSSVERALLRAGETYVETSRINGSYKDRTGVLRGSNGYAYTRNGVIQQLAGNAAFQDGVRTQDLSGDMAVTVGAGAVYGSYVEAKGYDVASSGHLAAERVIDEYNRR